MDEYVYSFTLLLRNFQLIYRFVYNNNLENVQMDTFTALTNIKHL